MISSTRANDVGAASTALQGAPAAGCTPLPATNGSATPAGPAPTAFYRIHMGRSVDPGRAVGAVGAAAGNVIARLPPNDRVRCRAGFGDDLGRPAARTARSQVR